jgi:pSer/pThr/pTyr-binding forkhead associated (FHA) protein
MKLVFPGGEHAPVELADGTITIGSSPDCSVVLKGEGVAARHCEIVFAAGQANVRPLDAQAPTVLNGRQVGADAQIKDGDLLVLGRVGCSVVGARKAAVTPAPKADAAHDDRTRVRAALPRFLLRGVSGATLGKTFAVTDNAVIGRQPDCDIPIPAEEVSRHHARLKVTPDGVLVEDMGSANGTYLNGKRMQSGLLKPGEELRLDTVRFLLITPGMDAKQQSGTARPEPEVKPAAGGSKGTMIVIGLVIAAIVVAAALHFAGVF